MRDDQFRDHLHTLRRRMNEQSEGLRVQNFCTLRFIWFTAFLILVCTAAVCAIYSQ